MSDPKYTAAGTVHRISEVETRKTFSCRRLVLDVTTNPKYPSLIEFEFGGKSIDLLDTVSTGDAVKVDFYLSGREWNGPNGTKVFNTLRGASVDVTNRAAPISTGQTSLGGTGDANGPDNDLPF